jgi:hypothetical protein
VLPDSVQTEIFTLTSIVGDAVIDYLCGMLEDLGYTVVCVNNYDSSLVLHVELSTIFAEIRIDRIVRQFEVVARCDDYTVLPRCGNWGDILEYLVQLRDGM